MGERVREKIYIKLNRDMDGESTHISAQIIIIIYFSCYCYYYYKYYIFQVLLFYGQDNDMFELNI